MSTTIKDVAKAAGVSISTVSKVINHAPNISQPTVDRVNAIIKELNYVPNSRAASFARQSTRTIAFLMALEKDSAYHDPHMFDTMCGAQSYLSAHDYGLQLIDAMAQSEENPIIDRLIGQKAVDGIIVHGSALNKSLAATLVKQRFPHIAIGSMGYERQISWIDTDNSLAGQLAAEHLLERGYKRLAYIGGTADGTLSRSRLKGAQDAAGLALAFTEYAGASMERTCHAVRALLGTDNPPDALICESNKIALGATEIIREAGISIPQQMGLITFDQYPYSDIMKPEPTIIMIDVNDLGREAAKLLLRKIRKPDLLVHSYTTLPMLVQGQTT